MVWLIVFVIMIYGFSILGNIYLLVVNNYATFMYVAIRLFSIYLALGLIILSIIAIYIIKKENKINENTSK